MKHLTIRNVDPQIAHALKSEKKLRGTSLNQTVLHLLRRALGLSREEKFSNGLAKLGGGWTEEEFRQFQRDTAFLEEIDEEMWR